jgi:hypothetical protein
MTGSSPQFPAEEVAGSPRPPAGRSVEASPPLAPAKEHRGPPATELPALLDHSPWLSGYLAPDYHADRQGLAHLDNHLKPGRCHLAISGQPHWVTHTWSVSSLPFSEGLADQRLPAQARRARILKRLEDQVVDLAMQNVGHPRCRHVPEPGPGIPGFASASDDRLVETIAATHKVAQAALRMRREASESVAEEVRRLGTLAAARGRPAPSADRR